MLRFDGVSFDPSSGFKVNGVQVEAMVARDEVISLVQVLPQFSGRSGLAGIITRGHDAATEAALRIFKAAYIVPLPAVKADRNRRQRL